MTIITSLTDMVKIHSQELNMCSSDDTYSNIYQILQISFKQS